MLIAFFLLCIAVISFGFLCHFHDDNLWFIPLFFSVIALTLVIAVGSTSASSTKVTYYPATLHQFSNFAVAEWWGEPIKVTDMKYGGKPVRVKYTKGWNMWGVEIGPECELELVK